MRRKMMVVSIFTVLICSVLTCSALAAGGNFTPPPSGNTGGPYGTTGFSGSGFTGNGFYPSSNSVRSYEIYNQTVPGTGSYTINSASNTTGVHGGWLGWFGLLGLAGLVRFGKR